MRTSVEDIELLVELSSLLSKYGRKNFQNVIAILSDPITTERIITLLNKSLDLVENEERIITKGGIQEPSEKEILISNITRLLKDKVLFPNTKELDRFIGKYLQGNISTTKKSDKLKIFHYYLKEQNESSLQSIHDLLVHKRQDSLSAYAENNDLSKWSDIILRPREEP